MGRTPANDSGLNHPSGSRPLASILAVTAGLIRLIPHLPNFAPVGGVGLFAGARLQSWQAFAIPLLIRLFSDTFLLLFYGFTTDPILYLADLPFVYLSLALNVVLGKMLRQTESPWRISALTLAASVQFFLLTNFGTWLITPNMYPHTLLGLLECYGMGLEFYRNTLLSDFAYAGALFGLHAWLSRTVFLSERVVALAGAKTTVDGTNP